MKNIINSIINQVKENKIKSLIISITVLILLLGVSFAAFLVMEESGEKEVTYGTLDIEYIDGETINAANSIPLAVEEVEEYASKTNFTIKNKGDIPVYIEISLVDINITDALKTKDFMYSLYKEDELLSVGTFENCGNELVLKNDILQRIGNTPVNYTIAIWIQDNGGDQNYLLKQSMSAKINVKATDKKLVRLPKEYQQVDYIESTGTQYIDTNIKQNNVKGYELKYKVTGIKQSHSGYQLDGVLGVNSTGADTKVWFSYNKTENTGKTGIYLLYNSASPNSANSPTVDLDSYYSTTHKVFVVNGSVYYNNQLIKKIENYATSSSNKNLFIFAVNNDSSHFYSKIKLYGVKFYNDTSEVIADYIPCYRKSDGEIGLYDLISNKFLTNSGTGEFIKGNIYKSKLPEGYQEVEYIQNDGTENIQYIDTGIVTSENNSYETKVQLVHTNTTSQTVWGGRNSDINGSMQGNQLSFVKSSSTYQFVSGNSSVSSQSWDNKLHLIYANKNKLYIDNEEIYTASTEPIISQNNVYLFATNTTGTVGFGGGSLKMYYFKIWNNDTLVRDYIPCYRTSDGVIGLYDLVENKFYTNSGTGNFSKGSDL